MPKSRQTSVMASPSTRRATKRRRSSITELAFHGINTSRPQKAKSVTHVSGTECHPCLGPLTSLEHSPPMTHGAESVGTVAFCDRTSGLEMLVRSRKGSLFALFSPKLWTVLNQYGLGTPYVTGLYELLLALKFEDLSLGR